MSVSKQPSGATSVLIDLIEHDITTSRNGTLVRKTLSHIARFFPNLTVCYGEIAPSGGLEIIDAAGPGSERLRGYRIRPEQARGYRELLAEDILAVRDVSCDERIALPAR